MSESPPLHEVAPGTRGVVRLPVVQSLSGSEVALHAHIARGQAEGPTLLLLAAQHGDEWMGAELLRRVMTGLDLRNLRGALVAVPVCNPPALEIGQRTVPDEAGGSDLNRAYPGATPLLADRLAATIAGRLMAHADALLDFHFGDWGVTWGTVAYPDDVEDEGVRSRAAALAHAFGFPAIHRARILSGRVGGGSAVGYAAQTLGIPSLAVSIGGPGFGETVETQWYAALENGIRRAMQHLEMLPGPLPTAPEPLVFRRTWYLRPSAGGILKSYAGPERLLTETRAGELLGEVVSPHTFDTLEQLVAPRDGILVSLARDYPVHPGNWGFAAAEREESSPDDKE